MALFTRFLLGSYIYPEIIHCNCIKIPQFYQTAVKFTTCHISGIMLDYRVTGVLLPLPIVWPVVRSAF